MSLHTQGFVYCGDVTGLRLEKFEHEDDGHDGGSRSAVLVVEAVGHDLEIGLLFADAASYEAAKAAAFDTCNTKQAADAVAGEGEACLYCVTMPYFDGDHDHGQYDLGIWSSWDGAKAAAEQLAEYCSPGEWEWKKLSGRPHSILCTGMHTDTYIYVGNVRIDEPLPDDLEECLSITYT